MSYLVLRQNTSNKLTLGQMDDNFQNLFWIKNSPYLITNTTFTYSFSNFESNWIHLSGVSGFFTASFTNVSTQSNTISIGNIYINQGPTGYHPLGLVLNGQPFTFSVSDQYYGRSFSTDIISFTFIRGNGSWTNISSQIESYRIADQTTTTTTTSTTTLPPITTSTTTSSGTTTTTSSTTSGGTTTSSTTTSPPSTTTTTTLPPTTTTTTTTIGPDRNLYVDDGYVDNYFE